ncbi:Glycine betaine transporter OpuD [Streptomyces sp. RB5]|uniref:Glycine betaine transporter OpuD n=1 Tax=Streptomyces smaragdinus TaxID=2585196 RepID=A0A7K0CGR5_9ACTN|nr:BCCT family transporter [Streptomyces smaragdinus]MQY12576.1 Glycine betaine transporter OpuD [Streptomyces smaragdinus]
MRAVEGDPPRTDDLPRPDRAVLAFAVAVVLAVTVWGAAAPATLRGAGGWVLRNFGWLYAAVADVFLVLLVVVALSRYGRLRLGGSGERPELTTVAWLGLLAGAGMGVGLLFAGVGEPLADYTVPPPGSGAAPRTDDAARTALEYALLHWTLHPWAVYGVTALALAYPGVRGIGGALTPLLGARAGRGADALAVSAAGVGTATALGLAALQLTAGAGIVTGLVPGTRLRLIVFAVLTAAFAVSARHRGLRRLTLASAVLAVLLVLWVWLFGPTVHALDTLLTSTGGYLAELPALATGAGTGTVFHWAWWLSLAPVAGVFLARISRGRTVRAFLAGVLLVPAAATAVWFSVLGGGAIRMDQQGTAELTRPVPDDTGASLFDLLKALPLGAVTPVPAMILVLVLFVAAARAGAGATGCDPPTWAAITWGVLIIGAAATLLTADGPDALRTATVLTALPLTAVLLALCVALLKSLRDHRP